MLSAPGARPIVSGRPNASFVNLPPRLVVAVHRCRPPWFHRNVMAGAMGLIRGAYDAKAEGFAPGGISLHNLMSGHGPDVASWKGASEADLTPHRIEGRSEEHTSELQSLMRISYAAFCLKKKNISDRELQNILPHSTQPYTHIT